MEGLIDHLLTYNKINQAKLRGLKVSVLPEELYLIES